VREAGQKTKSKGRNRGIAKAGVLVAFIALAICVVRFTRVRIISPSKPWGLCWARRRIWAPAAFILIYAAGVCLFVPGTLITAIGAAIFGPYWDSSMCGWVR